MAPRRASSGAPTEATIELVFREAYGRILATLIPIFGDCDRAEDALQEAFVAAVELTLHTLGGSLPWPERLQSVLTGVYLIFNECYAATAGGRFPDSPAVLRLRLPIAARPNALYERGRRPVPGPPPG